MKILYLNSDLGIPVLGRKGASVHVRSMIKAFKNNGHKVILVAPTLNNTPWEENEILDGIINHYPVLPKIKDKVRSLEAFNNTVDAMNSIPNEIKRIMYNQNLAEHLMRYFEKNPPDFIYERAAIYSTAGILASQALGKPLILELNAPLSEEQSNYREAAFKELIQVSEKWVLNNASYIVVVSEELKKYVISCGVDLNRIHVIPNGVNPDIFKPGLSNTEVKIKYKLSGEPILGFAGGLRPWHGVEFILEPIKLLIKKYPGLHLLIVGDGPMRKKIEESFKSNGLSKHITFTGLIKHHEVAKHLSLFDIALAPYPKLKHDFYFSPLKIFEYMASGIPVIAPDIGQISSIIKNQKTGLLYPPGNMHKFVEACETLIENRELRKKIGINASHKIHKDYTWDKNAKKIVNLVKSDIN